MASNDEHGRRFFTTSEVVKKRRPPSFSLAIGKTPSPPEIFLDCPCFPVGI